MDKWNLFLVLIIILLILILVALILRKIEKYRQEKMKEVLNSTIEYFKNMKVFENQYLECVSLYASNIDFDIKSKGETDSISQVKLKKMYRFFYDRPLYIFNDNLGFKVKKICFENKDYFILDNKIKTLQIYASFLNNEHLVAKYKIKKEDQNYILELDDSEVEINEEK